MTICRKGFHDQHHSNLSLQQRRVGQGPGSGLDDGWGKTSIRRSAEPWRLLLFVSILANSWPDAPQKCGPGAGGASALFVPFGTVCCTVSDAAADSQPGGATRHGRNDGRAKCLSRPPCNAWCLLMAAAWMDPIRDSRLRAWWVCWRPGNLHTLSMELLEVVQG